MKPLFKSMKVFYNASDDRAELLIEKGISHQNFLKLIDATAPFVIRNGTLYFIPEEKSKENVKKFIEQKKAYLEKFGDISPATIAQE